MHRCGHGCRFDRANAVRSNAIAYHIAKARGVTADHAQAIVDGIAVNLALDLSFDAPPSTIQP
jgi:hypothetical protein